MFLNLSFVGEEKGFFLWFCDLKLFLSKTVDVSNTPLLLEIIRRMNWAGGKRTLLDKHLLICSLHTSALGKKMHIGCGSAKEFSRTFHGSESCGTDLPLSTQVLRPHFSALGGLGLHTGVLSLYGKFCVYVCESWVLPWAWVCRQMRPFCGCRNE